MKKVESDSMQELAYLLKEYFESGEMIRLKKELKDDPYQEMLDSFKSDKKNKKRKK